jgi:transposase
MPRRYRSEVLDHLGRVAGMYDELGIGEERDRALQQNPETRFVTVGSAVNAMVLTGRGCVHQQRYLGPRFFQNKPTQRLIAPGIEAQPLHEDTLGRALETLYAAGVTALYRLMAAMAAHRLGLTPTFAHLDRTSFHVDGRDNSREEPDEHSIHLTRGSSRDHRPDLHQVMLDLMVAHQAGIPVLMKPLRGHTSDARDFGPSVPAHMRQLQTTDGTTSLVADSALYRADTLQHLADTGTTWITRVPATLTEAQTVLEHAIPEAMLPLRDGDRDHAHTVTYGRVPQRWVLIDSEHRRPQAQRTVDKHWLKQSEAEGKACQQLCHTALACDAEAQQALATLTHGLSATALHEDHLRPTPRDRRRGRPGQGAQPDQGVYQIDGGLASSIAARQSLVAQHRCFILATHELDDRMLPPQELLDGDTGQKHVEHGVRFLKDPRFLAAALYLKKPERIRALLMVMTVGLLVYAALEYRLRQGRINFQATFPNQKGPPVQNPTARWVFQYFSGIHVRRIPGEGPSCSMSLINIDNCSNSWGVPTRHVIPENTRRFAECRVKY